MKTRYLGAENLAVYRRLLEAREKTGLSVGALALASLTGQPFPTFALAGASRVEQVLSLRESGDAVLTEETREALRPMEKPPSVNGM